MMAPPNAVAPAFIETVLGEVATLGTPLWLVIDDLHVLTDRHAVESLSTLFAQMPPNLHLVVASRTQPALGLHRLRIEGRLVEIQAADLAFTTQETSEVLTRAGLDLEPSLIETLVQRTGGWAAGIRIAALALAGSDDPAGWIADLDGGDRAIADYLSAEVLTTIPAADQDFLLSTSICSELSVGLARELTDRHDAAALLDALIRANAFTDRVGSHGSQYRYHDMFRTFLATELRRRAPDLEPQLHQRAATWFLRQGEPLHALDHLVSAGDLERVVEVAAGHGMGAILDGDGHKLLDVMDRLSAPGRRHMLLALLGGAAAMWRDDLDAGDRWLAAVDPDALHAERDPVLSVLAPAVTLARSRYTTTVDQAVADLHAAWPGRGPNPDLALYTRYQRGIAQLYLGQYDAALTDLTAAARTAHQTGRAELEVTCMSFLGGTAASMSRLMDMRRYADDALALAENLGWSRSQATAHAHMLVAWSAHLTADPATARTHAQYAMTALTEHTDPDVELATRSVATIIAADGPHAHDTMRAYRTAFARLAHAQMSPALLSYAAPNLVRICLDLGERHWAQQVLDTTAATTPQPGEPLLLRALLLHDSGRHDAALRELDEILTGRAACHVITTQVQAWLLAASLDHHRDNPTRSHEHLTVALQLAEPENVVRPFLDLHPILDLLTAGTGRFAHHEDFAERIRQSVIPLSAGSPEDPQRLTSGELAILRELPSLMSIREIAQARALSINTVKTHLRSIYRKLHVTGRRQAVDAGRQQGLL